jgi:hypothetical protein
VFWCPPQVPDVGQQRTVTGQVASDMAESALPGIMGLVARMPKRPVSGPLANGEDECVPYGPL